MPQNSLISRITGPLRAMLTPYNYEKRFLTPLVHAHLYRAGHPCEAIQLFAEFSQQDWLDLLDVFSLEEVVSFLATMSFEHDQMNTLGVGSIDSDIIRAEAAALFLFVDTYFVVTSIMKHIAPAHYSIEEASVKAFERAVMRNRPILVDTIPDLIACTLKGADRNNAVFQRANEFLSNLINHYRWN